MTYNRFLNAEQMNGQRPGSPHQHQHKSDSQVEKLTSVDAVAQFQPFPVEVLPQPLQGFVVAGSKAIGCDPSFVAVPLLVACAAAIGNSRRVKLKETWAEPAILWAALVASSGDHKSPAIELALKALRELQRKKLRDFDAECKQYVERDLPQYDRDMVTWKNAKGNTPPPEKPSEPVAWRVLVDDTTIEALASLLAGQPRGLLLACDELAGWLGGFDKYKGAGKASDAAKWLEVHGGRTLLVDRKTGLPKMLCIPRATVSVIGGIQPEILRRCLTPEHRASGMSARLLVAWPPRRVKRWSEAEVHPDAEAALVTMIDRLLTLTMDEVDGDDPRPRLVSMSAEAKALWVRFFNEHADEQSTMTGELSAVWSKLEAYAPRLALVHHLVRWANGEIAPADENRIDAISMTAGITFANWFGHEARRVYAMLSETDAQREQRELAEWVRGRGGRTSVRDLMLHQFKYRRSADVARSDLATLVKAGLGRWETRQTGGHPAEEFVLNDIPASTDTPKTPMPMSSVDVDAEGIPEATIGERFFSDEEMDHFGQML